MKAFQKTVVCARPFDEVVAAVEHTAAAKGFRVLHTHDVAATLAEKGFPREPLKIVEVCNAKFASRMLEADVAIAVMLPCPISIYTKAGRTYVSTLLPSVVSEMYPQAGIAPEAKQVEDIVLEIVEAAAKS